MALKTLPKFIKILNDNGITDINSFLKAGLSLKKIAKQLGIDVNKVITMIRPIVAVAPEPYKSIIRRLLQSGWREKYIKYKKKYLKLKRELA